MSDIIKYVILDSKGEITYSADSFSECLKFLMSDPDINECMEFIFDHGIFAAKIMKVQKRPFKILREIEIDIHDEMKRKEVMNNDTKDHSCNDLFKEW